MNNKSCSQKQRNYEPPMTEIVTVGTQGVFCASPCYGITGSSLEHVNHEGFTMP